MASGLVEQALKETVGEVVGSGGCCDGSDVAEQDACEYRQVDQAEGTTLTQEVGGHEIWHQITDLITHDIAVGCSHFGFLTKGVLQTFYEY